MATEVPAAAPALAPTAAAPAAPTTPAVSDVAAPPASASSAPATTPAASEQPSLPSADSFGWDKWDGKVEAFPEPLRPWVDRVVSHSMKRVEDGLAEVDFMKSTYEKLLAGQADPRLAQLEQDLAAKVKEIETFQGSQKDWESKVAAAEAKAAELEKAWGSFQEQQALAETEAFKAKHAWMWDGGPIQKMAGELLDDGFEVDDLPVALKLPEPVLAKTRAYHKELLASGAKGPAVLQHAMRLARVDADIPKNPAADLVESGSRIASTPVPLNGSKGESLHDALDRVVTLELRKRG